jgi:hypothetical protein
MWSYHKKEADAKNRDTIQIQVFQEAKRLGGVPHVRAQSKHIKDILHKDLRAERHRLFKEGDHDQLQGSLGYGEVTALTSSRLLNIDRAEVLTDPKLSYEHPQLKKWFSPMSLDEQIFLMGGKTLSGRPEDAGYSDRYSFFPKKKHHPRPEAVETNQTRYD